MSGWIVKERVGEAAYLTMLIQLHIFMEFKGTLFANNFIEKVVALLKLIYWHLLDETGEHKAR
jgi:hypothetical protein